MDDVDDSTVAPFDEAEQTWLRAATGQIVRVHLANGKELIGQLLSFDQAALVIQGSAAVPLLVYKHGIAYVAVEERRSGH